MTETKFTPGPWVIDKNSDIVGADGNTVAVTGYYPGQYRREANARLIAAAPEMFEALRKLLEVCERQPRISKSFPDPFSPLGLARSALSKALGKEG